MQSTEPEIWKPIPGYEGYYEVSNLGRVRSLDRVVPHARYGNQHVAGRVLRPATYESGHLHVSLRKDGHTRTDAVHRLVANVFVPGKAPGLEVCHDDGNPANNFVGNLRWGTRAENMADSVRHGTHPQARKTHCVHGHPLSGGNLYILPSGRGRGCRTCARVGDERRRPRVGNAQSRKTHCKRGHEFTTENTWTPPSGSGRSCRACARLRATGKS